MDFLVFCIVKINPFGGNMHVLCCYFNNMNPRKRYAFIRNISKILTSMWYVGKIGWYSRCLRKCGISTSRDKDMQNRMIGFVQ